MTDGGLFNAQIPTMKILPAMKSNGGADVSEIVCPGPPNSLSLAIDYPKILIMGIRTTKKRIVIAVPALTKFFTW